ncbi:MAG: hypothetical protein DMG24_14080 [Acidobacteria bacterium]|nr:MAG: hypothetical protein DMG24_14080 [Acidobacteriota bacterium]
MDEIIQVGLGFWASKKLLSAVEMELFTEPRKTSGFVRTTNCCGRATGSERSSTASSTVKIAMFAPIPRASVSTATAVKPGFFASTRRPYLKSCSIVFIIASLLCRL